MFKLRILIVEDSDDDTQLMVREIRRGGYDVEWERIETRAAMESALVRQAWDLVISDHKMPQFSSTQALEVLNESGQDLPLLIISGSIGEEAAVAALKAGAHDFMTKGNLARLIPAIQRELKEAETRRERKKAEAALRATEARLSGILDLAADAVIVIDGHQRMILFNQSAEHIFGYKADEVLGQALEILLPSHLDKIHYEHVNAFRTAPEIRQHLGEQLEIFGRRKDGSEFPAEASISKLKQGDEITFTVIMRDITERKQAEEALRESNARFRSLFENTPVSIWEEDFSAVKAYLDSLADVQNPDLETYLNEHPEVVSKCVRLVKVQSVNQAALELHGAHTKAELLEKLEKTFTPKSFETFKKELLAIARGEHQMEMDEEVQTLSGEKREATLRWIVAPGHEKTYSKVLVSLVDITERKQRERELEAIASASSALRVAKTLDELLSRLLGQALALVEGEVGSIWLFDPSADRIDLAVHRGWQTDNIATSVKPGQGVPGLVVQNGETIVSREFRSDPRVIAENRDQIPKGAGGACVPLFAEESVVGVIFVNVQLPRELTSGEVRVLNALAEIGGNAIHRLRLHEQTIRQLERLEALRRIDLAITSSLDLRISLDIVLEQALTLLGVDAAAVLVMKPGLERLEFAAGRGFHTHNIDTISLRLGEGYAGQAALEQQVIHVRNLADAGDEFLRQKLLSDENFVSYFGVPLVAKGEVKGVLEIFHRSPLDVDMEWLNFLDSLGWQTAVAVDNALLFRGMQRSNVDLKIAYDATIEGWSSALDLRDKETEGHTIRVTETTLELARIIGMSDDELVHIRRGGLLHDIGKMGVPDKILLKPDKLTEDEWLVMRKHPEYAYKMLVPIAYLHQALDIPYCHHEKWDGTGYPRGLNREQIPLAARVFAVADVWDALTSDRPYRKAWSTDKALKYIREQSGQHFDPQVVEVFLQTVRADKINLFSP